MRAHLLFPMVVLLWLGAILPALAQTTTLPVRSGEHALFTRLVIQIPAENNWRVEARPGSAVLLVDGPDLRFDISQSFARIPRTRLRNLVAHENRLELELACPCEIRASEDIPQYLVIDIVGPSAAEAREANTALRPPPRPAHLVAQRDSREHSADRAGVALARTLRGQTAGPEQGLSLTLESILPSPSQQMDAGQNRSAEHAGSISLPEISAELGRAIARSVGQGKLAPARQVQTEASPPQGLDAWDDQISGHFILPHGFGSAGQARRHDAVPEACQHLIRLGPPGDQGGEVGLSAFSSSVQLHDAVGQLQRDAVIARARDLIAIGFGAEAVAHAALLEDGDDASALIIAIGRIIDNGPASHHGLSGLQRCGPFGSLWAFLGTPPERLGADFPFDQVVQAIHAAPAQLRATLAPHVVTGLIAAGRHDAAQRVGASLDRLSLQPGAAHQQVQAALRVADPAAPPNTELQDLPLQDMSDDVLRMVLAHSAANGQRADPELLDYAQDRLRILRGDSLGQDLAHLVAAARARSGEFAAAFEIALGRDAALPAQDQERLTRDLFDMVTQDGSDADFIRTVFDQRPWGRPDLSAEQVEDLAGRLTELGFSEQAALMRDRPVRPDISADVASGSEAGTIPESAPELSMDTENRIASASVADAPPEAPDGMVAGEPERSRGADMVSRDDETQIGGAPGREASEGDGNTLQAAPVTAQPQDAVAGTEPAVDRNAGPDLVREDAQPPTEETDVSRTGEAPSAMAEVAQGADAQGVLAQTRALLETSADLRAQLQSLLADDSPALDQQ